MNTPNSPHRPPPFYVLVPEYIARQLLSLVFVLILVGEGDGRFRNTMQRFSIQEMSAASWQPSEFLSWKGSQIFDGDEGVLPASADAAWELC